MGDRGKLTLKTYKSRGRLGTSKKIVAPLLKEPPKNKAPSEKKDADMSLGFPFESCSWLVKAHEDASFGGPQKGN